MINGEILLHICYDFVLWQAPVASSKINSEMESAHNAYTLFVTVIVFVFCHCVCLCLGRCFLSAPDASYKMCSEMEIAYALLVPPDWVHFRLASASQIGTIGSIEKLSNFFSQENPDVTLQGGRGDVASRERADPMFAELFYFAGRQHV